MVSSREPDRRRPLPQKPPATVNTSHGVDRVSLPAWWCCRHRCRRPRARVQLFARRADSDGQNVKLRLIGIDTPETHDPRKPVQCFGAEASAQATKMLAGRRVLVETDPTQGNSGPIRPGTRLRVDDRRTAAQPGHDPIGFAHEYTYDLPYRYRDAFIAAVRGDCRLQATGESCIWL